MSKISVLVACIGMIAVSCCNPRPTPDRQRQSCVSYCGMLFDGTPNGAISCDQIQEAEDVTLRVMDEDHCKEDPRMCKEAACKELFGYQLVSEDADAMVFIDGEDVYGPFIGITNPRAKTVTLARADNWRNGSIPHELVHVMQGGRPPASWRESSAEHAAGSGHAGWEAHGVYRSIQDIREGRK